MQRYSRDKLTRTIVGRGPHPGYGNEQPRARFATLPAIRATRRDGNDPEEAKATTTANRSGDVPCATSKPNAGHGDRDDGSDEQRLPGPSLPGHRP